MVESFAESPYTSLYQLHRVAMCCVYDKMTFDWVAMCCVYNKMTFDWVTMCCVYNNMPFEAPK